MKTYDVIVVLGSQPDFRTWKFPSHTYASLDLAVELSKQGVAPYIAVSGDHALKYDNTGVTQPFKEGDAEEEYLLSKGVLPAVILKETESRDTVAQFYFMKNKLFKPNKIFNVLMITTDFRVERLQFLWQKVMGPDYSLGFETVRYEDEDVYKGESEVLQRQREWLKSVTDGDDSWFADKFYDDPYYTDAARRDKDKLETEIDPRKQHMI